MVCVLCVGGQCVWCVLYRLINGWGLFQFLEKDLSNAFGVIKVYIWELTIPWIISSPSNADI